MLNQDKTYWLGYNDILGSGKWTWADNSQTTYQNWDETFSNDTCAALNLDRKWQPVACENKFWIVCKK